MKADEETIHHLHGAEWHISYFSQDDKKKIEAVMAGYGCKNINLHHSINECIRDFEKDSSAF